MKIEIRSDNSAIISGYVNVVGRESRVLHDTAGAFVEIIAPHTFTRALEKNDHVGLMFNHQRDVTPQSLELKEDNIGLYARAEITDSEVIQRAKDNQLTGWSFGFYLGSDEWTQRDDGMRVRKVTDLDLVEVSMLDCTPAYIATSIEMRGENTAVKECRYVSDDPVEIVDRSAPKEVNPPAPDLGIMELYKRKFNFITHSSLL